MPVLGPVKWNQDNPVENVPILTEDDKHAMKTYLENLDKLLQKQKKAKFKIELFLGKRKSIIHPVPAAMSFWESGHHLHGGGDVKIYICPGKLRKVSECESFIPFSANGYGHLVCPGCGVVWKGEDVIGEVLGRNTMLDWADVTFKYFRRLEMNCDIYLKHSPDDIRSTALAVQANEKGKVAKNEDSLTNSRKRGLYIYPLRNIIKDISAGAELLTRIRSFLRS